MRHIPSNLAQPALGCVREYHSKNQRESVITQEKRNPHGQGAGFSTTQVSGLSPLDTILARLEGVRKHGKGFTANCPAHHDKTASLSITEAADYRVLMHCFAGCPIASVMGAVGLTVADCYPRRATAEMTPQQLAETRIAARNAGTIAALGVLAFEAEILLIGGRKSISGTVSVDDLERMEIAVSRVQDVKGVLSGR
ncbi:MAG: hypothetical protein RLZZ537_190 [Pseudomonadota bacterium]|jgi:hypothetical protein